MLDRQPYQDLPELPTFDLRSTDVEDGGLAEDWMLSAKMGIEKGADTMPQLSWSDFPEETKSFVVTCFDPDAPTPSGFWHYSVANLPVSTTSLERGHGDQLPAGAVAQKNDGGSLEFTGFAPPAGHGAHRYTFCVTAVDTEKLDVDENTTPAVVNFNLFTHGIARAFLTVIHEEK